MFCLLPSATVVVERLCFHKCVSRILSTGGVSASGSWRGVCLWFQGGLPLGSGGVYLWVQGVYTPSRQMPGQTPTRQTPPRQTPLGKHPPKGDPQQTTPWDGHCIGRYTTYWNGFFLWIDFKVLRDSIGPTNYIVSKGLLKEFCVVIFNRKVTVHGHFGWSAAASHENKITASKLNWSLNSIISTWEIKVYT